MGLTRRQAIMAGLGTIVLSGCSSAGRSYHYRRHTADWPANTAYPAGANPKRHTQVHPADPRPIQAPPGPGVKAAGISVLDRSNWTRKDPISSQVNPMTSVSKITVHHEGWDAVTFTGKTDTAERIEKIRRYHVESNKWGDIGYHYIIDRQGRVWEGRPIQYQGAHVKYNNENNLGILVLGNFDKQSASSAQLDQLFETAAQLKKHYRIKASMVRSHKEIRSTSCPGKNLQKKMDALRTHVG